MSHHDALVDGGTERGTAYGVDLEVGQFRQGTHLQVGLVAGDNWLLGSPGSGPPRFAASQIVASRYTPLRSERFEALEPLLRVSWADAHQGQVGEDAWLFTPGVFLYVRGRNRIGANLDVYAPDSGDTEAGLKIQGLLPLLGTSPNRSGGSLSRGADGPSAPAGSERFESLATFSIPVVSKGKIGRQSEAMAPRSHAPEVGSGPLVR